MRNFKLLISINFLCCKIKNYFVGHQEGVVFPGPATIIGTGVTNALVTFGFILRYIGPNPSLPVPCGNTL